MHEWGDGRLSLSVFLSLTDVLCFPPLRTHPVATLQR